MEKMSNEQLISTGQLARICCVCGRCIGYKEGKPAEGLPPITHTYCDDCLAVQRKEVSELSE